MRKLLVLLSAVALVVAFTIPAMAADWNFYGSSRMTTFMVSQSEERGPNGFEDDDLTWALQGNSRIGATVKAGDIGGGFEYGTGINLRKLYGTWNFGAGTLLVGQTYTPVNLFYSNQVCPVAGGGDDDMLPYGGVYDGRRPMIQVSMGGFKFALVQPSVAIPGALAGIGADTDSTIPKLEAAYSFKVGPVGLQLVGGYATFEVVDVTDEAIDVDSYVLGLGFNIGLGPVYIKGNAYMGKNVGQFGLWQVGADDVGYDAVEDETIDNDAKGYLLVVGFKASDALSFEGGYGNCEFELEGGDPDETSAYYVQATISLAKGFTITPEIGKINYKEDAAGNDQGDTTYYGAKWQINF